MNEELKIIIKAVTDSAKKEIGNVKKQLGELGGSAKGASGKIGKDKLFFNGNLKEHPSYDAIINFLNLYNVKPIFDESYKLTDIGSIIPITEKI